MSETVQQLKSRFAKEHATERMAAIEAEREALIKAFPVLGETGMATKGDGRKTRTWTAAQRAQASKRAKAWHASQKRAAKKAASNIG